MKALDSTVVVSKVMRNAAKASNARPVHAAYRHFDPQGVTGIMMVQESHFSIHTWPEAGYAAIDAFTCGRTCDPSKSIPVFIEGLGAESVKVKEIIRGVRHGAQKCVQEGLEIAS